LYFGVARIPNSLKKNDLLAERLYVDICFSYVTKLKKKEIKNHRRDIKINAVDNSKIVKSEYSENKSSPEPDKVLILTT